MTINNVGIKQAMILKNEYPVRDPDYIPKPESKVASIMKLQQQIVALENQHTFIKVTVDESPMWKFQHMAKLNII